MWPWILKALAIGLGGSVVTEKVVPAVRRELSGGVASTRIGGPPIAPPPIPKPPRSVVAALKGSPLGKKLGRPQGLNRGGTGYVVSGMYKVQSGDTWDSLAAKMKIVGGDGTPTGGPTRAQILAAWNKGLVLAPVARINVITPVSKVN